MCNLPKVIQLAAAGISLRSASSRVGVNCCNRARRYRVLNSLTKLSHSYLPLCITFPLDCEIKFGKIEARHHTEECRNHKCTFQ